jgi:predicted NBD/HSP70 family sugar kinase
VDASRIRVALADLRGERLAARHWPTPNGLAPGALISKIAGWMRALMGEAGIPPDRLLAVAAAASGVVDHARGVVVGLAPNLEGWEQLPMGEMLKEALGGVGVVVENDVNMAILGERWRGAARGQNTCAFVYIGTGIGAGIVVNGELHRGHHFLAGEIGLMCMTPDLLAEPQSAARYLENLPSIKALGSRWGAATAGAAARRGDIFSAAEKGDRKARKLIEEAAQLVGIAITHLTLTIDPSLVVLAGTGVEHGTFLDQIRDTVARIVPTPPEIAPAKLGEEASLWGCLLVATSEARVSLNQRLRA